jgi:DMSO/TMAO reductase YedYZ molybdopterin-dependent catalytic subunit
MTSRLNRQAQRVQLEQAMRRAQRLPPGQALTLKFPVLHMGPIPRFDPATWTLRVFGEVETDQEWDWRAFEDLPRTSVTMDVHCVTRWSKFDTTWDGVSLSALIEAGLIRLKPGVRYVLQHCEHGFTTNLPLDVALQPNFLLATHFDGRPLEPEHGFPLRGVIGAIPGRSLGTPYLWKGGKWLRALEFLAQDQLGYWEQIGYHNRGDVWQEERWSRVRNLL